MANETITEYETVEKEREVTICDSCGQSEDECEITTVAINPKVRDKKVEVRELANTFEDKIEVERDIEKLAQKPSWDRAGKYGVSRIVESNQVPSQAAAEADVCLSCADQLLDLDLPEIDPEDEVHFHTGGIEVKKEGLPSDEDFEGYTVRDLGAIVFVTFLTPIVLIAIGLDRGIDFPKDSSEEELKVMVTDIALGLFFGGIFYSFFLLSFLGILSLP